MQRANGKRMNRLRLDWLGLEWAIRFHTLLHTLKEHVKLMPLEKDQEHKKVIANAVENSGEKLKRKRDGNDSDTSGNGNGNCNYKGSGGGAGIRWRMMAMSILTKQPLTVAMI